MLASHNLCNLRLEKLNPINLKLGMLKHINEQILVRSKLSEGFCGFSIILYLKTRKTQGKILEDPRLIQALSDSVLFVLKFKV